MKKHSKTSAPLVAVSLVLVLAACGGGDRGDRGSAEVTEASEADMSILGRAGQGKKTKGPTASVPVEPTPATAPITAATDPIASPPPLALSAPVSATGQTASPGATPAREVDLSLIRIAAGEGTVLVSSGIPLQPGVLRATDLARVSLRMNGVEQPIHVAALKGKHLDGSLRSILIQFKASLPANAAGTALGAPTGTPLRKITSAKLFLDLPRTLQSPPYVPVTSSVPDAAALPSSPEYLIATDLVGAATPASLSPVIDQERQLAPGFNSGAAGSQADLFTSYDARFAHFSQYHWDTYGEAGDNYYDRMLSHYAAWARTGDYRFWERATALSKGYRTFFEDVYNRMGDQIVLTPYGRSPHQSFFEGSAIHYWVTGDPGSRKLVVAGGLRGGGTAPSFDPLNPYQEGRIVGRALLGLVYAYALEGTAQDFRDWQVPHFPFDPVAVGDQIGQIADAYVNAFATLQLADGSFKYRVGTEDPKSYCGQSNFMEAVRAGALIRYYRFRKMDSRVPQMVTRMTRYLLDTQWNEEHGVFRYHSRGWDETGCTAPSAFDPTSADLNGIFLEMVGWSYFHSGDSSFVRLGDSALDANIPGFRPAFLARGAGEFLHSGKQFNQNYYASFAYLAYRRGIGFSGEVK